jgi:RimJ/RimL family protein N-acetyltransferase
MILRELKEARESGRLSLAIQHQESKQWIGILEFWGEVPSDKKPWIGLFMIHKLYQHTGLGREVIQQFFRFALSQGYHELRIGVDMENQSGKRFWELLGFLEYTKKEVSYPTGVRCVRCMEVRF